MPAQRQKGKTKKHQGRNVGPSRNEYWRSGQLRKHKVRNLMRHNGMTQVEAQRFWDHARVKRCR